MSKRIVKILEVDDEGKVLDETTTEVDERVQTNSIIKLAKGGSQTSATPNDVRPPFTEQR